MAVQLLPPPAMAYLVTNTLTEFFETRSTIPLFISTKYCVFHNVILLRSQNNHILYKECAKIQNETESQDCEFGNTSIIISVSYMAHYNTPKHNFACCFIQV